MATQDPFDGLSEVEGHLLVEEGGEGINANDDGSELRIGGPGRITFIRVPGGYLIAFVGGSIGILYFAIRGENVYLTRNREEAAVFRITPRPEYGINAFSFIHGEFALTRTGRKPPFTVERYDPRNINQVFYFLRV